MNVAKIIAQADRKPLPAPKKCPRCGELSGAHKPKKSKRRERKAYIYHAVYRCHVPECPTTIFMDDAHRVYLDGKPKQRKTRTRSRLRITKGEAGHTEWTHPKTGKVELLPDWINPEDITRAANAGEKKPWKKPKKRNSKS